MIAPRRLIGDQFAIRGVITAIRNALTHPDERQPSTPVSGERRKYGRLTLDVPVRVTRAVVEQGGVLMLPDEGSSVSARTRDISLGGIGLAHSAPLPGPHAVVVFHPWADAPISIVVEVAWSHATAGGEWLSGTKILGLTD